MVDLHVQPKSAQHVEPEPIIILGVRRRSRKIFRCIVHHVQDVELQPFAKQSIAPAGVNHLTLGVHHVVILQQSLAHSKVVLLHFFLRSFNRLGNHRVLDNLSFFKAHAVHPF